MAGALWSSEEARAAAAEVGRRQEQTAGSHRSGYGF